MNILKFAVPLILVASNVRATEVPVTQDPFGKIASLDVVGCGNGIHARLESVGTVQSGAVTIKEQALALDFDDFHLSSEDNQQRLACLIDAVVRIPANKLFCIRRASVHGYAELRNATATLGFDYALQETHDFATAERRAPAGRNTDLEAAATIARPGVTPCSHQDQYVHLSGSIWLDLFSNVDDGSGIRLTGQSSSVPANAGWVWGWVDCTP